MKIVHFADLHLGVESYGHTDPESGLSSRFLDLLASFDYLVDFAVSQRADLVLFCGDAYKNRDPSQTQQREFARRIKRLSESGIPVFLLVGNHDVPNALGRATATEIFETLSVENVHVAGKPSVCCLNTNSGPIQIVALPWLRRSSLLTREESQGLELGQLNQRAQEILTAIIEGHARQLDPAIPAVLAAHVWVQGARVGSEESLTIGQEHVLLPGTVANPAFDYVALGHIHRHQVLVERPPTVYSGSLDGLDFGDEGVDKGFYMVDIKARPSGRKVSYEFHPVPGRRFITIKLEIQADGPAPTETVLTALCQRAGEIAGNVVRLELSLSQETASQIRDDEIRRAAGEAYYFAIAKTVRHEARTRLGGTPVEGITPLKALETYISLRPKEYSATQAKRLLECGGELIGEALGQSQ